MPGLAAGRHALDHDRVEPFRRGIDRRGEPGRPGADHRDVMDARRVDRLGKAQRIGQAAVDGLRSTRSWARSPPADWSGVELETVEEAVRVGIGIGVEQRGADSRCGSGSAGACSVSAACPDPISVTPPCAWRIRPTRRRMKARMMISPISGSAETMRRKSARLILQRRGCPRRSRPLTRISRSLNRSSSPENWRARCVRTTVGDAVRIDVDDVDRPRDDDEEIDAPVAAGEERGAGRQRSPRCHRASAAPPSPR